ncbi:MAG: ankyrin repeat domain-containing protein [Planctomycetales bacterium]|nr:ankyrin repeat domain-containing protein [bacterium]UNM09580.1 MAG: ankyrin repeat domain-containing protein [Planctomycetales bacterium]
MGQNLLSRLALCSALAPLLAGCSNDSGNARKQSAQNTVNARPPVAGEIRYEPRSMDEIASLLDELPVQDMTEEQQDALAFIRATDADDSDTVRQLIADGRQAAAQIGDLTALHFAVRKGNIPIIKLLLDADDNRDYGLPGSDELTLELACRGMDDKVLAVLVENGLKITYTNSDDWRIQDLDYSPNPQMLDYLLADRPEEFVFAEMIRKACFSSNPDYLRHMLVRFGDIRMEPFMFDEALHSTEMMQVMIDKGLTIELRESTKEYESDELPNTLVGSFSLSETFMGILFPDESWSLTFGIPDEHDSIVDILEFLQSSGADFTTSTGKQGLNPVQAQLVLTPYLEVLQAFAEIGYDPLADWDNADIQGYPGYFIISSAEEIEESLQNGDNPLDEWEELGFRLDARMPYGKTLLGVSMLEGFDKLRDALLERSVAIGIQEASGLGNVELVKSLYDDASDLERTRACSMAAMLGQNETFDLLLKLGADAELRDFVLMGKHELLEDQLAGGRDPDGFIDDALDENQLKFGVVSQMPFYFTAVRVACELDDVEALELLDRHGADLEVADDERHLQPKTIQICIEYDSPAALQYLLDNEVISWPENYYDGISSAISKGSIDCAAVLLANRAAEWRNWTGDSLAYQYVRSNEQADNEEIERLIQFAGEGGKTDFLSQGLLKELSKIATNYNPYAWDGEDQAHPNLDNVRLWLESGADTNVSAADYDIPFDSSNGVMELALRSGNQELIGLLVEYGGSKPPASELAPLLLKDYLLGEIRLNYGFQQY